MQLSWWLWPSTAHEKCELGSYVLGANFIPYSTTWNRITVLAGASTWRVSPKCLTLIHWWLATQKSTGGLLGLCPPHGNLHGHSAQWVKPKAVLTALANTPSDEPCYIFSWPLGYCQWPNYVFWVFLFVFYFLFSLTWKTTGILKITSISLESIETTCCFWLNHCDHSCKYPQQGPILCWCQAAQQVYTTQVASTTAWIQCCTGSGNTSTIIQLDTK